MKSNFKAFITGIWLCAFSFSFLFSSANNIRISGTVQVSQGTGDTLVLSFPLRWDNSWRDQFNWDAAWIFFKYKSGTGGWNPVNLCAGGHRFVSGSGQPVPFDCMPGNTGSNTLGLFIYRNALEAGNTPEIVCQVKCLKSSLGGLTPEKFQNHEGFILAQAIEMVYVPYGIYYLGDGECSNRFAGGSDGSPVLIDSEGAITASTATKVYPFTNNTVGTAQSIAAAYPKGYKGFYMMKYEVSQEQWVYFLNTLTYVQQQERVPGLSGLKRGEYIFGSKNAPSNRNGIVVAEPSYNGNAVIFANNLNNNEIYSEDGDGKTIACNYLSPSDMLAYCSWSGLRPMSELEYEKVCRSPYPEQPIKGEYAWHDNGIPGRLNAVSNGGMRNERSNTANANVNAGNAFGPVRCGLFATGASTQQGAGASFWGGMELSGNLKELCYNIAYTGFNGATTGTGVYNTALWSATPAHFGVRGGGFSSADSLLRISDRTVAAGYFADINKRDSTVGFRGVRTTGSEVTISQGKLIARQGGVDITGTACPDVQLDLTADVPAKVMSGGKEVANMDISYTWYVLKPGATADSIIPGASGATLSYNDLKVTGTSTSVAYKFRRKAICPVGEAMTDYIAFAVSNMKMTLSSNSVVLNTCGSPISISVTAYGKPVIDWNYNNTSLCSSASYPVERSDFGNQAGVHNVECRISNAQCKASLTVEITLEEMKQTFAKCGDILTDCQNNTYTTIEVGPQCWMSRNLRRTDIPFCYVGSPANIEYYGVHYYFKDVMKGKMIAGGQGICPDGWHIPTVDEWNILINNCGGTSNAGTFLQADMNMVPAGFGYGCTNSAVGSSGYYGSSNNDGHNNGIRVITTNNSPSVYISQYMGGTSYPYSYRCIKD